MLATIVKIEKVYDFTCRFDGGNIVANIAARRHRAHHLPSCIPASEPMSAAASGPRCSE